LRKAAGCGKAKQFGGSRVHAAGVDDRYHHHLDFGRHRCGRLCQIGATRQGSDPQERLDRDAAAIDHYTLDKEAAPQSLEDLTNPQSQYLREIPKTRSPTPETGTWILGTR